MSGRNLQIHAPLGEARESPGGGRQRPLGGRAPGRGDRGGQAGSRVAVMAAGSLVEPGRVGSGGETTGKASCPVSAGAPRHGGSWALELERGLSPDSASPRSWFFRAETVRICLLGWL